jgi:hypothetical protein
VSQLHESLLAVMEERDLLRSEVRELERKLDRITSAVPLNYAASYLRVPVRWLREEVNAGRVPALMAGRAVLIHVPTVAALLSERARSSCVDKQEVGHE